MWLIVIVTFASQTNNTILNINYQQQSDIDDNVQKCGFLREYNLSLCQPLPASFRQNTAKIYGDLLLVKFPATTRSPMILALLFWPLNTFGIDSLTLCVSKSILYVIYTYLICISIEIIIEEISYCKNFCGRLSIPEVFNGPKNKRISFETFVETSPF